MKKIIVAGIIIAGFFPRVLISQDAGEVKEALQALPDGFSIISVNQEGEPVSAKVRKPDGKVVTVFLIKDPNAGWRASSNRNYYRSPDDLFVESEQKDEADIKTIRERERVREERQRRDQDIADDVVDDLQ